MNNKFSLPEETIQAVWEKAVVIPDYDKDQARHDSCGRLIYKESYGMKDSAYGWVINHTHDESNEADIADMKPLHWENNLVANDPVLIANCGC